MTQVIVVFGDGCFLVGESYCSAQDNFNREIGRNIALERAARAAVETIRGTDIDFAARSWKKLEKIAGLLA
jgi:hypothetical protein